MTKIQDFFKAHILGVKYATNDDGSKTQQTKELESKETINQSTSVVPKPNRKRRRT